MSIKMDGLAISMLKNVHSKPFQLDFSAARGMAWVMYATAAALLIVAAYLAISGQGLIPVVALVFGGAWVVAGRLFARAALKP